MPNVFTQVILAITGISSLTILCALGKVDSSVIVPIIAAFVGGGVGHVNGYRQGKESP